MPLGYKYVARDADSQINYAEIGQQAVGTLQDWYNTREEKKEAYKQASRESINNLMDAPQGQNQDANAFINNYAHDMINQKMADKDLFERGYLSEKEYTLRMQNQMDGTKQLFQIQKLYQENFATTMQGIQDGTLQSGINTFNMGMVEGYGDFNNSKATINPTDGSVGIGLMENKIIDGQTVRVLSKNIAPVNVIRGKILQKVATFDVDGKTTSFVANLGDRKDAVYRAASTARAGSITEYTGYEFIKNLKDPVDRQIAENFNKAIDDNIESYWAASPYNLTSVLTENLGKYDSKSFTFDKDLADKDPNKILVTIDPNTQMTTLDKSGKNYDAQMKEANAYVKTQILSKLDAERKISTTGQLQDQSAEWKANRADKNKEATTAASMLGKLWYGDNKVAGSAVDYFKGFKNDKGEILFTNITRDKTGVNVTLANGTQEHIDFLDKDGRPRSQEDFIRSAGPLLAGQIDVNTALEKGSYNKGARFNENSNVSGATVTPQDNYKTYLTSKIDSSIMAKSEEAALPTIQALATQAGLLVKQTNDAMSGEFDVLEISNPNTGAKQEFYFNRTDPKEQSDIYESMIDFMSTKGSEKSMIKNLKGFKGSSQTSTKPVLKANPKGVGSKYK
jgi:hypothetical protein